MQPCLFRQRLLELAAEYEGLHALHAAGAPRPARRGSARSLAEVSEAPGAAEGPAAAGEGGVGERALPRARNLPSLPEAAPMQVWPSLTSDLSEGSHQAVGGALAQPDAAAAVQPEAAVSRRSVESADTQMSVATSEVPQSRLSSSSRFARNPFSQLSQLPSLRSGFSRSGSRNWGADPTASWAGRMQFSAEVRKSMTFSRSSTRSMRTVDGRPAVLFVNSRAFTVASALVIIISTLLIGIETQTLSSLSQRGSGSDQLLSVLSAANYALTLMFAVEVFARVYAFRLSYFVKDRVWNCFDIVILLLALVEIALELIVKVVSSGNRNLFGNGGMAKMLRLFRLTRLLRIVRTFRQLKPLRVLVHSIASASKSVFWALLLLFMIIYAFGVILTQAVTEHTEGGRIIEDEYLVLYYGDLFRSMLSLWMAVSGGINWHELTAPLVGTGNTMWTMLFLLYITFVYFFVLNVVTGVFCQNAIEGAQQDLDLTIEAQLREKQVYAQRLKMLFEEMNEDYDAAEGLSAADLQEQMEKPKVQSWFKSLDIDTKQTWKLFKILDVGDSGIISLQAFIDGCLQMRGSATRVDVESLKWEIRSANARAERTAERIAQLIESAKLSGMAQGAAR